MYSGQISSKSTNNNDNKLSADLRLPTLRNLLMPDLADRLQQKIKRRLRDLWPWRDFHYGEAANEMSWRDGKGVVKGRGIVVAVCDVEDREGKRPYRIDVQLKRHHDHPGAPWIALCAGDAATKAKWLGGLPQEIMRKPTLLDEDGNAADAADAAIGAEEDDGDSDGLG